MPVTIRTHHVDITPALKDYAQKKMGKLEKFFENIREIQIELDISDTADENKRQIATGMIKSSQKLIRATEASKDMYASVDIIFDKLEKQLIKHKEKLKSHKEAKKKRTFVAPVSASTNQAAKTPKKFLKEKTEKRYISKPVTPEEAAQVLDLDDLDFLVFRNAQTEEINVIYPLSSGDYGLIEP